MKKELTKDQSFKIEEFLKRIKLVENQIDLTSFRQRVDSQSVIKDYVNDISDYGSIKNQLDQIQSMFLCYQKAQQFPWPPIPVPRKIRDPLKLCCLPINLLKDQLIFLDNTKTNDCLKLMNSLENLTPQQLVFLESSLKDVQELSVFEPLKIKIPLVLEKQMDLLVRLFNLIKTKDQDYYQSMVLHLIQRTPLSIKQLELVYKVILSSGMGQKTIESFL